MPLITHLKKATQDKHGKLVLWQAPNLPLICWFVLTLLTYTVSQGNLHSGLSYLASAFLFVWAYLELAQGSSHFRRLLGLVVITYTVVSRLT